MSKHKLFKTGLFGVLFGIYITNNTQDLYLSMLILIFFGVLFLNFYIYYKKLLTYGCVTILSCCFGMILAINTIDQLNSNMELLKTSQPSPTIEYTISSIKKIEGSQITYTAKLKRINNTWVKDKDIMFSYITTKYFPAEKNILYSQKAKMYINSPENKSFYQYQLSQKNYFRLYHSSPEIIYQYKPNSIISIIDLFRADILSRIHSLFPTNEALFLGGILLGAREDLPKDLKTNFNNSGLTHFIAVSGFNITIIVIFIGYLLTYVPHSIKLILMPLVIVLFVFLVGTTAPVIRAAIMGVIGFFILNSGRKADITTILLISAVMMCLLNPYILNYDISFQLSFLAVVGILMSNKYLEKAFAFIPNILAIREAFVLTLGAMIFTLPIMVVSFGQLSIIAPLANILVSWTIPLGMLFGFLGIIVDFVSHEVALYFNYITWVFLRYDIAIVNYFGTWKYSVYQTDLGIYKSLFSYGYYLIVFFIGIILSQTKEKKETT